MTKKRTSKKGVASPRFPRCKLTIDQRDILEDNEQYEQRCFSGNTFHAQQRSHLTFDQVIFQNVSINGSSFHKISLVDSRFTTCDLANAFWIDANIARVEMFGCRLTGLQAIEGLFRDIYVKDCHAEFLHCAGSTFRNAYFEHCDLKNAYFAGADLTKACFLHCDLTGADFSKATLAGADLRGSLLDRTRLDPSELKGAIIDMGQAVILAQNFGLIVDAFSE